MIKSIRKITLFSILKMLIFRFYKNIQKQSTLTSNLYIFSIELSILLLQFKSHFNVKKELYQKYKKSDTI